MAALRCFGNNIRVFANTPKKNMAIQKTPQLTTRPLSMHPNEHDYVKSLFENPGRPLTSICPKKNANFQFAPRKMKIRLMIVIASIDYVYIHKYVCIYIYINT